MFSKPVAEIIQQRYSCRTYQDRPIEAGVQERLIRFLDEDPGGPFGARTRFILAAATETDRQSLNGLGTYGFIKGATGFIAGVVRAGLKNLEDYGYTMERIILYATDLGLGTCWLGGSFTKSSFAKLISIASHEIMPAVTATGYASEGSQLRDAIRLRARGHWRMAWEELYFNDEFCRPISPDEAGEYALPLEMTRWAPSASNKQPWRIVKRENAWHFYLRRTEGYGRGSLTFSMLQLADLQRVDLGIAMCHFELTAREKGLGGTWAVADPGMEKPDDLTEYIASWVGGAQAR